MPNEPSVEFIADSVRQDVARRLAAAEREHGVRVLLAVESGSRAWGFSSPDSDFDVRFIYAPHRDWYLDIEDKRDVIEYPIVDEIDINGWDVRKALNLFRRSNPAFVEWIQSPIIYAERGIFAPRVRDLLPTIYDCAKGIGHYRSMAWNNFRGYLREDLVPLKKYFYVLRPLLAIRWIDRFKGPPPIEFARLLDMLHVDGDAEVLREIDQLLVKKRAAGELERAPRIEPLNAFIASELEIADSRDLAVADDPARARLLNSVFRDVIDEPFDVAQ
jgi:uncharacterized protein